MSSQRKIGRRAFLASTAAAATGYAVGGKVVFARRRSANEMVNVGLIGLGGRCTRLASTYLPIGGMRVVAVCDCFKPRVDAFVSNVGKGRNFKGYVDFRKMIEKENLDGVMIETTTHARAWVTCHAMAMGVDAYIEKPMCLSVAEGRHMVDIARKYKRVTQVGTQQRSIPLNNWASDLVKNGAIGKVKEVLAPNFVGPIRWTPKPAQPMPPGGSDDWWDIWTNQVEMRPYHTELPRGWKKWWAYDPGGLSFGVSGWGTHSYDQVQRGLGTDETGPVEVVLEEPVRDMSSGKFEKRQPTEDETGAKYYNGAKNKFGPRAKVSMKYASGTELKLHLDGDWGPGLGCIFVGEKGKIEINRDKISATPRGLIESSTRPAHLAVPETQPHIENWVECIKTRDKCTADIEYGQRSSTICYLVNIAREVGWVGEKLKWDPAAERFTNCDKGNKLLARARRKGYELPT
ncbi:MAG TPA: Gfo/Idh/MocA family oxidoreductase [Phycisphaerales bacterium]|nr:Gfo/Idh/MocA family oxidoreductase [Phycisphaerales bacterium]